MSKTQLLTKTPWFSPKNRYGVKHVAGAVCLLGSLFSASSHANVPVNSDLFIFTVDSAIVDDTVAGSFTLPVDDLNYQLYWEEIGNEAGNNSGGAVHVQSASHVLVFPSAGSYRIGIDPVGVPSGTNDFGQFVFNDARDDEKLISIEQWGTTVWTNLREAFEGTDNFAVVSATDSPNLTVATDLMRLFASTPSLTAVSGIGDWDTASVVDMNCLFCFSPLIDPDVSQWNTGSVTTMRQMFRASDSANPNLALLDTSSVTDMSMMFYDALVATPNTAAWDTSSVTTMNQMFRDAPQANPVTSAWDTSSVTNMGLMFFGAVAAAPDVSAWDVSQVTAFNAMFQGATIAQPDTTSWNTSSATTMNAMFNEAFRANPDTSGWDTSQVTDMINMFRAAAAANPDTSSWDTSSVTNMGSMFLDAALANPDVSGWDVSQVTNMANLFNRASNAQPDTSLWDTSSVTNMSTMFKDAVSASPDTSGWDTSLVTTFASMFDGASAANPDTSGWVTSQATTMASMFEGATIANPDTSGWDTSSVTSFENLFRNAFRAVTQTANWDTSQVTSMEAMFENALLASPDTSAWDTSQVVTMESMFENAPRAIPQTGSWDMSQVVNIERIFRNAVLANPDTSTWDTSSVTSLLYVFDGATIADPDVSNWDVSNVTRFSRVFSETDVANPDVSNWDVSAGTQFTSTFLDAKVANPDVSNWDVSSATSLASMFVRALVANPDVSSWDTGNVISFNNLFNGAVSANPDVSAWDTSSGTSFVSTFRNNPIADPDVSQWDTSSAIDMGKMFSLTDSANPDVSGFDTSSVVSMIEMFAEANAFDRDIGAWDMSSVSNATGMFSGSSLSIDNYDALLAGWSTQSLQSDVTFHGGDSRYCESAANRNTLTETLGWLITDDGFDCSAEFIAEVQEDSASTGGQNNANGILVTAADLRSIRDVEHVIDENEAFYQVVIASETDFSNPPVAAEIQSLIDDVNSEVGLESVQVVALSSGNSGSVSADALAAIPGVEGVVEQYEQNYQEIIALDGSVGNPPTAEALQEVVDYTNLVTTLAAVLEDSASANGAGNADSISVTAQALASIPGIEHVLGEHEAEYQSAIAVADQFSNPPTVEEVQAVVHQVNTDIALAAVLEDSASAGGAANADAIGVTVEQLAGIEGINNVVSLYQSGYRSRIAAEANFSNPPLVSEVQILIDNTNYDSALQAILEDSVSAGGAGNADEVGVTTEELAVVPNVVNVVPVYEEFYRELIAAESGFSFPPTAEEIQAIIDTVNNQRVLLAIAEDSISTSGGANADGQSVTAAELAAVPGVVGVQPDNESVYQTLIATEADFGALPTTNDIQSIVDAANRSTSLLSELAVSPETVDFPDLGNIVGIVNLDESNSVFYFDGIAQSAIFRALPTALRLQAIIDGINANASDVEDTDGDGLTNSAESGFDSDADGITDDLDLDSDNDGLTDAEEGYNDYDNDGTPDFRDLDSDNDGIFDLMEARYSNSTLRTVDVDLDGRIDATVSLGANGLADFLETFQDSGVLLESAADSDADAVADYRDIDSDNDGILDEMEARFEAQARSNKTSIDDSTTLSPFRFSDGISALAADSDNDGREDYRDADSDNDGIFDIVETFGQLLDLNGDGQVDLFVDANLNGFNDTSENLTINVKDTDSDGLPDQLDRDSDGDGWSDAHESGSDDLNADGVMDGWFDSNGDGIDDGIAVIAIRLIDTDGDGIPNFQDGDSDNDGLSDLLESGALDLNGDGIADSLVAGSTLPEGNELVLPEFGAANPDTVVGLPEGNTENPPEIQEALPLGITTGAGLGCSIASSRAGVDPVFILLSLLAMFCIGRRRLSN